MFGVTLSEGSSCLHGVLEVHENAGLGNKGAVGACYWYERQQNYTLIIML
mgnify:CR=1 FL=1